MRRMNYMRHSIILLVMFLVPLGAMASTYFSESFSVPAGMSCVSNKVVSFGYTHRRIALVEMAAIIT